MLVERVLLTFVSIFSHDGFLQVGWAFVAHVMGYSGWRPASPVKASKFPGKSFLNDLATLFDFQAGWAAPQRRLRKALPGFLANFAGNNLPSALKISEHEMNTLVA